LIVCSIFKMVLLACKSRETRRKLCISNSGSRQTYWRIRWTPWPPALHAASMPYRGEKNSY
jgi:hypothetical protein